MNRILSLALLATALSAADGPLAGTVSAFGGLKALDEEDHEPVDDHLMLGGFAAIVGREFPVGIMASVGYSWGSEKTADFSPGVVYELSSSTTELAVGPVLYRRVSEKAAIYAGAGLVAITAKFEIDGPGVNEDFDGNGTGVFFAGGGQLLFKDNFGVGIHLGFSKADVEVQGEDLEGGGLILAAAAGYHF